MMGMVLELSMCSTYGEVKREGDDTLDCGFSFCLYDTL